MIFDVRVARSLATQGKEGKARYGKVRRAAHRFTFHVFTVSSWWAPSVHLSVRRAVVQVCAGSARGRCQGRGLDGRGSDAWGVARTFGAAISLFNYRDARSLIISVLGAVPRRLLFSGVRLPLLFLLLILLLLLHHHQHFHLISFYHSPLYSPHQFPSHLTPRPLVRR